MSKLIQQQETKISNAILNENKSDCHDQVTSPPAARTPPSQTKLRSYKIIVLGESGVGKTCLSFRFCAGRFPLHSEATIGLDFREKVRRICTKIILINLHTLKIVEIDGERLKLQLWDTAGQERFRRSITHHYYR